MKYEDFKKYQWYIVVALVSFVSLFFLPMLGSEVGLEWKAPTTAAGWALYVIQNIIVATISMVIFHCFILQGEKNIEEDPGYIRARDVLKKKVEKEDQPRSPGKWKAQTYGLKGSLVSMFCVASLVGLSNAILVFDWVAMLVYLFTIIMSIVFGVIQMHSTEKYYTEEFVRYADKYQRESEVNEDDPDREQTAAEP